MRLIIAGWLAVILSVGAMAPFSAAYAQLDIVVRVDVEPPPLPVYDQPPIPEPGYLWVPGYWAWDDDVGYYWVPGTWVLPPEPELLWTPGYWGWEDGLYLFHPGYWGPHIGFYGGVIYGFGYNGVGYEGGYWRNRQFFYNRTVNNITNVSITNVYSKTVIVNNTTHVSYNGGTGGTTARPTLEQLAAEKEHHVPPSAEQIHHVELAARDPSLSLNANHGHPKVAATAHAAVLNGPGVVAAKPGKPIAAIEPKGHSGPNIGRGPTNKPLGRQAPSGKTIEEKRLPAGSTANTPHGTPSDRKLENKRLPAGGNVGKPPGGQVPRENKVQSQTIAHPPTPQVARPPAPPKPHVASPPPPLKPHVAPPPPPPKRPPPPAPPKPKCEPGKPCH